MDEILDWALLLGAIGFAIAFVWMLPRVWRADPPDSDQPPDYWPYSLALWRGVVRLEATGGLFFVVAALFLTADRALGESPVKDALAWGGLVVLVLGGCVVLFNEPKRMVPPRLRHQPGLIAEWRTR